MKTKKMILLLTILIPLFLHAQTESMKELNKDTWRFAAGVTLLSNQKYEPQSWLPNPYEIHIKYKINQHQILKVAIPLDIKPYGMQKEMDYTPKDIDIVDYYYYLKNNGGVITFQEFTKRERKIYGLSIGYNYEYPILDNLSAFAGIDISYQYKKSQWVNRLTHISVENKDNNMRLLGAIEEHVDIKSNYFDITPTLGINYKWKRILVEGSINYGYSKTYPFYSNSFSKSINGYYIDSEYYEHISYDKYSDKSYNENQFFYKISMYYLF